MQRGPVDRPLLLRQENRAEVGFAHFEPGAERPALLAHPVVMARMRTLEAMDKGEPDAEIRVSRSRSFRRLGGIFAYPEVDGSSGIRLV